MAIATKLQDVRVFAQPAKTVAIGFLTVVLCCLCFQLVLAQQGPLAYWSSIVESFSLPQIAETLSEKSSPDWPKLGFSQTDATAVEGEESASARLALNLLGKMRRLEASGGRSVDTLPVKEVEVYSQIAELVAASGGYTNHVLADTARRMALSRMCFYLVAHPDDHQGIAGLLTVLGDTSVNIQDFATLATEELDVSLELLPSEALASRRSIDELLRVLGTDLVATIKGSNLENLSTSYLIENRRLDLVLWRMITTDLVGQYQLAGLVGFLERGGTFGDIVGRDIGPFNDIMGRDRLLFKFEILGRRLLSPTHLIALIDQFDQPSESPDFLSITNN